MSKIMEFEAIKTERLYIKVAEQLRTLIDNDHFKVGDRFPAERVLAEKLGVSRPTIREAMIALEISGLVDIRTGSGIYVANKKNESFNGPVGKSIGFDEILEMRYILEPEICALAAARINDIQIQELKELIKTMEAVDITPEAFEIVDHQLHIAIAAASENAAMETSIQWLWKLRVESIFTHCIEEEISKQGLCIEEHKKIVLAITQRNPERARIAMKNHLDNATTTTEFDL
jgi:DNA-binding FadR family transcriptional regulator